MLFTKSKKIMAFQQHISTDSITTTHWAVVSIITLEMIVHFPVFAILNVLMKTVFERSKYIVTEGSSLLANITHTNGIYLYIPSVAEWCQLP